MKLTAEEERCLEEIVRKSVPNARSDAGNMDMRLADFDIDSMGMVTLMFDIEEVLGFEVDLEKIETEYTLGEFVESLEDRRVTS